MLQVFAVAYIQQQIMYSHIARTLVSKSKGSKYSTDHEVISTQNEILGCQERVIMMYRCRQTDVLSFAEFKNVFHLLGEDIIQVFYMQTAFRNHFKLQDSCRAPMSCFSTIRPAPATNHKQKFNYQVSSDPEKKHIEQYQ